MILALSRASADVLWWALVLVGAIVVLGAAMFALRRCFFASKDSKAEPPWSLQHLRDLQSRGQITEAEFQRLRDQMLGSNSSRKDRPASHAPGENAQ